MPKTGDADALRRGPQATEELDEDDATLQSDSLDEEELEVDEEDGEEEDDAAVR